MEGVGDEKGKRTVNLCIKIAFDQTLKRGHEMRQDVFRDGLGLESIQQPLDDAYRMSSEYMKY